MVDTAVLGHLDGAEYLAGVALGGAIFSLLFMGMNFLRMGTTGITAQAFGQRDAVDLREALLQAVIVATALAAIMIALQSVISSVAWRLLEGGAAAETEAAIYFSIRIWSAPATLINFVLIGWFIGLQNTRVPLLMVVSTNVVNIVLDLLFVVGMGLDTEGVAYATLCGELTGMLLGGWFAARELKRWPATSEPSRLFKLSAYRRFFSVNSNILIRTLALVGTLAFITAQGARFGETILAANAILMNLQYLLSYGLDGLAHAAEALVGSAWGERQKETLKRAVTLTLRWSVFVALGYTLVFGLFGKLLIHTLTDLDDVRTAALIYLPWLIVSPLISVFSFVYDGVFIGATWTQDMRNIMLSCAALVFAPVWWLTLGLGNHGLWLAFTAFMAARGIGMLLAYRYRINSQVTADWLANA